ncbi:MAG: YceI family protein, partial [Persicimonas sp.]
MSLAFAAGCKSEIDDKAAAKVGDDAQEEQAEKDDEPDEKEAEGADEEKAELRELAVTSEESSIGWVGAKVTGDHTGGFNEWSGTLYERGGELEKMEFTVDTTSVFSDTKKLTKHLKSDDFFHVEEHPEASFVSKKIVEKPVEATEKKKATTHEVTGDFTIRGVTNELTFPAAVKNTDDKLEATTEFTFNRFDFDIKYKGKPDDLIRKEVLLKVDLVAAREADKQAKA